MKGPRRAALAGSAAIAALAGVALTGCPPSLDDPDAFQTACPAGFSVDAMLPAQCARAGCHLAGPSAAAGLDLASPDAFARMYGKPSACGPLLVSPDGPSRSLLVAKLTGTASCGARMPLGGEPLPRSQIACVEDWITAGIAAYGPPPPADAGEDAGYPGEDAGAPDAEDGG